MYSREWEERCTVYMWVVGGWEDAERIRKRLHFQSFFCLTSFVPDFFFFPFPPSLISSSLPLTLQDLNMKIDRSVVDMAASLVTHRLGQ